MPLLDNIDSGMTYGQVHQVKFAHADALLAIWTTVTALNGHCEDRMGPRTVLVHVGSTDMTYKQGSKGHMNMQGTMIALRARQMQNT